MTTGRGGPFPDAGIGRLKVIEGIDTVTIGLSFPVFTSLRSVPVFAIAMHHKQVADIVRFGFAAIFRAWFSRNELAVSVSMCLTSSSVFRVVRSRTTSNFSVRSVTEV